MGATFSFEILDIFPFTSESKRMGLVVRDLHTQEVTFYQKGADVIMAQIVQKNDWLEEECGNMAREGLRTLVIGRKRLSDESWRSIESALRAARVQLEDRNEAVSRAVSQHLEHNLELLGVTGVEDKLQDDVRLTLELLRNAGIKIWMLTGDKIETATCIAISSKLVSRNQYIHQIAKRKLGQNRLRADSHFTSAVNLNSARRTRISTVEARLLLGYRRRIAAGERVDKA